MLFVKRKLIKCDKQKIHAIVEAQTYQTHFPIIHPIEQKKSRKGPRNDKLNTSHL